MSRAGFCQLRLPGVLQPGRHYRRWAAPRAWGPLQWHLENVEATITGWTRRHLYPMWTAAFCLSVVGLAVPAANGLIS